MILLPVAQYDVVVGEHFDVVQGKTFMQLGRDLNPIGGPAILSGTFSTHNNGTARRMRWIQNSMDDILCFANSGCSICLKI